jgi:hypothetical protein
LQLWSRILTSRQGLWSPKRYIRFLLSRKSLFFQETKGKMIPLQLPTHIRVLRSSTRSHLEALPFRLTVMPSSSSWVSSLPVRNHPFQSLSGPPTITQAWHLLLGYCHHPLVGAVIYMILANLLYLARRAHLRRRTMLEIWRIRTTRESGVSWRLFTAWIVAWQVLVALYPFIEPVARCWKWGHVCFFYTYPKAKGGGYILEPLSCQRLASNLRTRQQVRCDWHRFKYNVGALGRDGYRHPPTIQRNLPHFDVPQRQVKHWPWRRRHFQSLTSNSRNTTTVDTHKEKEEG